MGQIKKIAVLTSGGDAPGMNAAIRAVVRGAIANKLEVMGVLQGYEGLITNEIFDMDSQSVSNIIQQGGTILKSARCEEFNRIRITQFLQIFQNSGLDHAIIGKLLHMDACLLPIS